MILSRENGCYGRGRGKHLVILFLLVIAPFVVPREGTNAEPLRLGFLPYIAPSRLINRYTPLAEYLATKLVREPRIIIAKNYEEHIWNIRDGRADIAFLGAATYVRLVEKAGAQRLLARYEINGQSTFQGVIIVTEESPLTDLSQMRNRRMAFGDPRSTLSHLVPRAMLLEVGLNVNDLKRHAFLGSHDNVVMGVLMGRYDAGGIAEEVYAEYQEKGIRELARSTPVSTHVFIATACLSESDARRVAELLHGLDNDPLGRRVIEAVGPPVTGFVPATDSDYDGVREVFRTLRAAGVEP